MTYRVAHLLTWTPDASSTPGDFATELIAANVTQDDDGTYSVGNANGPAWAQCTVSVNRSGTVYQASAWWDWDAVLNLGVRERNGSWTFARYTAITLTNADSHRGISLGVDPDGYIHVAYNHHAEALNYRKSAAVIESWSGNTTLGSEISMVGTNETEVTYPTFFNDASGNLYFIFRDGASGNGDLYFYKYNHSTTTWAAATGTGTGGLLIDGKTSVDSPYWLGAPKFDSGGDMHLAWYWRDTNAATTNFDPSYVKWNGTTFEQADGTAQTVPITPGNCEVIETVASGSGLNGFSGASIDGSDRFHTTYIREDGSGDPQIYHAIYDSGWTVSVVSTGTDTRSVPNSFIDGTRAWILSIETSATVDFVAYLSDANDFTTWTRYVLFTEPDLHRGVNFDVYEWDTNSRIQILCLMNDWRKSDLDGTAFDEDNWSGYDEGTVTNPASDQTDVPLLIDLSTMSASWWAAVQSDGADIRVTKGDGTTELAYDLVASEWDYASTKGLLRVLWGGTLAASGTQKVRVWAGYTGGTATAYATNDDYGAYRAYRSLAYHPDGGNADETGHGHDMVAQNGLTMGGDTGPLGYSATLFDSGSTEFARTVVPPVSDAYPVTMAWFIKRGDTTTGVAHMDLVDEDTVDNYLLAWSSATTSRNWECVSRAGGSPAYANGGTVTTTWKRVVAVWASATSRKIYVDGALIDTDTTSVAFPTTVTSLVYGYANDSSPSNALNGTQCQNEVYRSAWDADLVALDNTMMTDQSTFWGTWAWTQTAGNPWYAYAQQ